MCDFDNVCTPQNFQRCLCSTEIFASQVIPNFFSCLFFSIWCLVMGTCNLWHVAIPWRRFDWGVPSSRKRLSHGTSSRHTSWYLHSHVEMCVFAWNVCMYMQNVCVYIYIVLCLSRQFIVLHAVMNCYLIIGTSL